MKRLIEWLLSWFRWPEIEPAPPVIEPEKPRRTLAWGNKVSAEFREIVFVIAEVLSTAPDNIMACMAWESDETFSPSIKNKAGSGATGLIQFMPKTAIGLGTTVEKLAVMTAEDQLEWVLAYFKPYRSRLHTLSDLYMAILWPAGIGKPENFVLWSKGTRPTTYRQNAGLDVNGDHDITKAEAASKVQAKLILGRTQPFLWVEP